MRKLLILGGSRYILPVIKAAHELGCYVITCDYLPHNIAHQYSDAYFNISILDKKAVMDLAVSQQVDGIMSFACDPGVITAAYVAEKLGLPTCGPYESVCILQNKKLFREFLRKHGFRVPMAKGYRYVEEALEEWELFQWPVIVKPVDSAGSKGVSKADNPEALRSCIEHALSFSQSKEFIVEDFLECRRHPSDSECFSVNGDLQFVSYSSQRFDRFCENPYAPAAFSWTPGISEENQKELTEELQRLLRLLDMGTSLYNVEARECRDGKAYLMECSPRGGGNRLAEMLRYIYGVDLISNAVRAALGDPVSHMEKKPSPGHWAEIILHGDRSGAFQELLVAKGIQDNVMEKDIWIKKGDRIDNFSGANKAIGTLVLRFASETQMNQVLDHQEQYIQVRTE